ncbi:pentatricopeptide repeat-containing protein At4g39952, mitochondrial-like [Chenopodium quinoa]|uniref:pentatricopeptide repeat-containing protein At4g39952, mitochondrial-like n=1 Tax=Chenopodium quinoa TaxID=63459 RepID=UPI000B76BA29|nr:pentatricopeptide repeat-containing protein At4g39952, mitochondrial-like [Chenopodium quinoa]
MVLKALIHFLPFSNLFPVNCRNFATLSSSQCYARSKIKLTNKITDLKPLKSLLIVTGLSHYKLVISEFIDRCFHLGTPELGLSAFYASDNRSLLLQNLIVKHLCRLGLYQDVISVYKTCKFFGTKDGDYTFPYVIKACSVLSYEKFGKEIHGIVIRTGYDRNVVVQTAFVDFYSKIGCMDNARLVFDKMSQWDVVSWNALISGYSFNGLDYEALKVVQDLWVKGVKPNVITLASIVPVCTRLGFRYSGWSLHGYAVKCGFDQDELLTPALISMYANEGHIRVARCLFDLSPIKNVVIWNSMIYAHAQNQMPEAAFKMLQQMLSADLHPNVATFVSVIPCCEKANLYDHGEILHGYAVKQGMHNQISVATALISMYEKLGDVHSAANVFTWMPHKNLLVWNSIISAYVHHGLSQTSLNAVHEMQVAGIEADSISIVNILSACSVLEALLLGKSAHAVSIRKGFDSNHNVLNVLLKFYSSCCQLHSSFKLFDLMASKNTISWNTMISGCTHNGETEKAEALFVIMQLQGVQPDVVSLISILSSLTESGNLARGMALHGFALKSCFTFDVTLANALISMYSSCGDLDAAAMVFHSMTDRCLVSWNSLITSYRHHNLHKEVIILFKNMIKDGQNPNYITLLNVLPGCSTLLQGKSVHSYAITTGAMLQAPFVTSLICMYASFNNIVSCFLLFEAGDKLDISLWNVMLSVLFESREVEKAYSLFCELLQTEVKVDYITILSLVSACIQINSSSVANSILASAIKNGFLRETIVSNAFIDLYAKCGDILMAKKVFEVLPEKDIVSWSVMINGHGLHGDGEGAISLLSEMEGSGIKPDSVTYLSILSACSHAGLADQSYAIFNLMLKNGIQPTIEHCGCVVDLLGRKGLLIEAYDIVKRMPGGASVSILESLLGACMVHGNLEIGERTGELLINNRENVGAYVILHNIYAGAGRWQDANRMRSIISDRELSKISGFSMLEGQKL